MVSGPTAVGGSAGVLTTQSAGALVADGSPAATMASFAATLAQLAPNPPSVTMGATGEGLFVGDLGVTGAPAGADQAVAGLSSEMALVARLVASTPNAPAAMATPSSPHALETPSATGSVASTSTATSASSSGVTGADIVGTALSYRGTPYVWGGTSPSGFDCSGLTQYVYARWGIAIPRTSEQQATIGTPVASLASAQPGDLLFFAGSDGTASSPGHVGIYVGNGEMIDAPYTGTTVQVQPLSSAGSIVAIRRVLGSVS